MLSDITWVVTASTAVCNRPLYLSMFRYTTRVGCSVCFSRGWHRYLNGFHFSGLSKAGHYQHRDTPGKRSRKKWQWNQTSGIARINSKEKIIMIQGMLCMDKMIWTHTSMRLIFLNFALLVVIMLYTTCQLWYVNCLSDIWLKVHIYLHRTMHISTRLCRSPLAHIRKKNLLNPRQDVCFLLPSI